MDHSAHHGHHMDHLDVRDNDPTTTTAHDHSGHDSPMTHAMSMAVSVCLYTCIQYFRKDTFLVSFWHD